MDQSQATRGEILRLDFCSSTLFFLLVRSSLTLTSVCRSITPSRCRRSSRLSHSCAQAPCRSTSPTQLCSSLFSPLLCPSFSLRLQLPFPHRCSTSSPAAVHRRPPLPSSVSLAHLMRPPSFCPPPPLDLYTLRRRWSSLTRRVDRGRHWSFEGQWI